MRILGIAALSLWACGAFAQASTQTPKAPTATLSTAAPAKPTTKLAPVSKTASTEPDPLTKPCAQNGDLRTSDLCAQWKAADATRASAEWAGRTYDLTVVSTAIASLTLLAAVVAAIFAGVAAKQNKRSADAAMQSLTRLERPYLFVESVITNDPITREWYTPQKDRFFEAQYTIRNYGRSPAILRRLHAQIYIGDSFKDGVPENPAEVFDHEIVIAGGRERSFGCFYRYDITPEVVGALFTSRSYDPKVKPTRCYLFGSVEYESVYGARDEVGFCWEFLVENDKFYPSDIPRYSYRRELAVDAPKKPPAPRRD